MIDDRQFNIKEASEILGGYDPEALRQRIREGKVRAFKLGQEYRITLGALRSFLQSHRISSMRALLNRYPFTI